MARSPLSKHNGYRRSAYAFCFFGRIRFAGRAHYKARSERLSAVALTDHNTVNGLKRFLDAARAAGIEGIPGAEFSTDWRAPGGEIREAHIVGLFIPARSYGAVSAYVAPLAERKKEATRLLRQLCAGADTTFR